MTPVREAFSAIPFNDDADKVQTWKGLAISAIMDMRRYADDELPNRRMVSVEACEEDAVRIASLSAAPGEPCAPQPAAGWDEERVALINFVSSQRQSRIDPELRDEICNRLIALRREAPAPAEQVHAINGPFASPAEARLREALERIASDHTQYDWPIDATSGEAMTHVAVQMREIARQALSPPSGGDEAKESEGGKCAGGIDPGWDECPNCGATMDDECRMSRPSEPSPPADRREIVARKFDDWFDRNYLDPDGGNGHLPDWLKDDLQRAWDAALDGGR